MGVSVREGAEWVCQFGREWSGCVSEGGGVGVSVRGLSGSVSEGGGVGVSVRGVEWVCQFGREQSGCAVHTNERTHSYMH